MHRVKTPARRAHPSRRWETARPVSGKAAGQAASASPWTEADEVLVVDARAALTPAQFIERKLVGLLEGRPMPFSHLLLTAVPRRAAGG